jgi:hypothetical protein
MSQDHPLAAPSLAMDSPGRRQINLAGLRRVALDRRPLRSLTARLSGHRPASG